MSETHRAATQADPEDVRSPLWEEVVAAREALVPVDDADAGNVEVALEATGNLARYLRWQVRDWARQRGVWIAAAVLAVLLTTWLTYDPASAERLYQQELARAADYAVRFPTQRPWWVVETPLQKLSKSYLLWTSLFSVLGSVVATFGIVARERERGLQRFLFAKPVRVVPYYLQKLAVAAAGYAILAVAGALLASLLFGVVLPVGTALAIAAAVFATLGTLTFFLSTLTRFDGAGTIAALFAGYVASMLASPRSGAGAIWRAVARVVRWMLPPVFTLEAFTPQLPTMPHMSVAFAITWIVVYAIAAVAAGIAVLRRRSIIT